MTSVGIRIGQLVAATGLSRKAFAEAVGVDVKSISNYIERDMNPSPRIRNLILNAFPAVSRLWFEEGVGDMYVDENCQDLSPVNNREDNPYYAVDFICGFNAVENDTTIVPDKFIKSPFSRPNMVWCNVSGESMRPTLTPGDIIAIEEVKDIKHILYGEIYAVVADELRTIKRIRKGSSENKWLLVPDNVAGGYQDLEIDIREVIKVYRVVGFTRSF